MSGPAPWLRPVAPSGYPTEPSQEQVAAATISGSPIRTGGERK